MGEVVEPTVEFFLKAPWKPKCAHHVIGDQISEIKAGTEVFVIEGPITLNEKSFYRVKCGYQEGFVLREKLQVFGAKVDDLRDAEVFAKGPEARLIRTNSFVAAGTSVQKVSLEETHVSDDGATASFVLVQYRVMGKAVDAYVKSSALTERLRVFGREH